MIRTGKRKEAVNAHPAKGEVAVVVKDGEKGERTRPVQCGEGHAVRRLCRRGVARDNGRGGRHEAQEGSA